MSDNTDKALEEYLDGKSPVSRGYARLGADSPPAALDRAILAAAQDAVEREEDATVIRVRRWRRWSLPVALAATVVVAVPLVVRVIDLTIDQPQPMLEERVFANRSDTALDQESNEALTEAAPSAARRADAPLATAVPQSAAPAENPNDAAVALVSPAEAPARAAATNRKAAIDESSRQTGTAIDSAEGDTALLGAEPVADTRRQLRELQAAAAEQAASARREPFANSAGNKMANAPASLTSTLADDALPETGAAAARARPDYLEPERFIERIAGLYRDGQTRAARRELGELLTLYPHFRLPDDFPLERPAAIYPDRTIIREADDWLADIATLADAGRIDAARQELARFVERYPDYQLPGWFVLTREDAAPIER